MADQLQPADRHSDAFQLPTWSPHSQSMLDYAQRLHSLRSSASSSSSFAPQASTTTLTSALAHPFAARELCDERAILAWYRRIAQHATLSSFLLEYGAHGSEPSSPCAVGSAAELASSVTDRFGSSCSHETDLLRTQVPQELARHSKPFEFEPLRPMQPDLLPLARSSGSPPARDRISPTRAPFEEPARREHGKLSPTGLLSTRHAAGAPTFPKMTHDCTLCSRSFHRHDHLELHMLRHKGERPHACHLPGCGRRFTRFDELTRHLRSKFHVQGRHHK
eukprot:m.331781 g.331781  ORF g.331781 m.331781 type:complete len:278 (-) comp55624_c0_seq1:320-1153(-)